MKFIALKTKDGTERGKIAFYCIRQPIPQHTKNGAGQKTSDSKQLQVTMNNSKKLQVTTTYSIKALRSRQPCNNPAANHSNAAAE